MPWAVAGAVIGAGSAYYSSKKSGEAAKDARRAEADATREAIARGEEAFATTEQQLAPFMGQELAASNQLMAQMGMAPQAGGWGAGIPRSSAASGSAGGREGVEWQRFMEQMLGDQIAIAMQAGYSRDKAVAHGAKRAEGFLQQLKREGSLPEDFVTPSLSDLTDFGHEMGADNAYNFKGNYGRDPRTGKTYKGTGPDSMNVVRHHLERFGGAETMLPQYFEDPDAPQVADETGYMAGTGGAPQAMQAEDILELQGIEGLDPELRDQYMAEVMRSAEDDPALAEYLGLTPGSARVGAEYQELPAYQRAMEMGREEVAQAAAGAGGLYSGRRGEAVSRMAHDVEGRYYDRAQREHEAMLGRRFGQRGAEIGLMGTEVAGGRQRQRQAYDQYMAILTGMAQPTTTTNVGSMRQSAASGQGANIIGSARYGGETRMTDAATTGAAIADVAGGLMEMGSAFIDRDD